LDPSCHEVPVISVYYPPHAQFTKYDILLAYWDETGKRAMLVGYQLKEGADCGRTCVDLEHFEKSFLIRGKAAKKTNTVKQWVVPSDTMSASDWSPKRWRELMDS
jgi:hypothetical protein